MRTRLVQELHQAFLVRGGFKNSTVWSLTNFIELLNSATAEVWRLLAETWQDYCLHENVSVSTVVAQEAYQLPDAFWRLRLLEIAEDNPAAKRYRRLRRVGLLDLNRFRRESGDPVVYHLRGVENADVDSEVGPAQLPSVIVAPTPTSVRSFRITYIPTPPIFTVARNAGGEVVAQTFDTIIGYDKLLLELCLYDAYKRSKMPVIECQQEIARLTQDLKSTAPNWDAAEPETIAQYVRQEASGSIEDLY